MIKVSAVSYHNTTPMIYGIKQTRFINQMDLQLDIPAVTALKFMNDEVMWRCFQRAFCRN